MTPCKFTLHKKLDLYDIRPRLFTLLEDQRTQQKSITLLGKKRF